MALRVLRRFFRPYARRVAVILVLTLLSALLSSVEPLLYKAVFDRLTIGPLLLLGGVFLSREATAALLDRSVWRVRLAANFDVLSTTIERLHALPLARHREEGVGGLMTKIERGISGLMSVFSEAAFQLVPAIVYLVASAIFMFRLEWRLALVVLFFAPWPAILGARASVEQVERERDLMKRWTSLYARLHEVLSGIAVVKSFVKEEDEKRRFLSGVAAANEKVVRGVETDARTTFAKNVLTSGARFAAIGAGALLVLRHEISLGTLVAFLGYVAGVFQPVQSLTGVYQTFRKGVVAAETVTSILDHNDSLGDAPGAREVSSLRGDVRFERVSFGYEAGTQVLHDIDLEVTAGETIALVGESGGGKSSLMALLQRLYDPSSGRILVDGLDIRTLKQRSLRRQIGVVMQDGTLFDDSVYDNILFGRPDATREEVEAAAKAANADRFIRALDAGYGTRVGERGSKLSGGERQRIAIARAVLKDAPILILDEATSALDAESEDQVASALERLRAGRTTFVIAHRLSTVTSADRIVVMKHGRIVEIGRHHELIERAGAYAELVRRQTRRLNVA